MDKSPSFIDQPPDSPINRVSARLVIFPDPKSAHQSGSCCRIAQNLYVTAAHVVTDWIEMFGASSPEQSLEIWAIHINPGPEYSIFVVEHAWLSPSSDLALLRTKPYNDVAASSQHTECVALDLLPPKVGDRIVGFGNYSPNQEVVAGPDGARHIEIHGPGAATVGEVIEVHAERRDSARLSFPCFQVNARFDGGMSGGPVFNEKGRLCGIICSSLPPTSEAEEHVSYATTLWPLMGIEVDASLPGQAGEQRFPAIELAKRGIIHAHGHDRVFVQKGEFSVTVGLLKEANPQS